jgi:hypothetical protein
MSTITPTMQPAAGPAVDCYPLYRMSIEQYEKMVDAGVFTKGDKLELINGLLRPPRHPHLLDRQRRRSPG